MIRLKQSVQPGQPPSGADMNALIVSLNEARAKLGLKPLASKLPNWKRWVGGEKPDYDGTGLRDTVNANALFTNQIKGDLDGHGQAIIEMRADIKALQEAPPARPFP